MPCSKARIYCIVLYLRSLGKAWHVKTHPLQFLKRNETRGVQQGRPFPPEAMMHSPLFQIPPVFEQIFDFLGNFRNFTFSRQNFIFSSVKISDDLASNTCNVRCINASWSKYGVEGTRKLS